MISRLKLASRLNRKQTQAEGCFGAIEELQAAVGGPKIFFEFLQPVRTVGPGYCKSARSARVGGQGGNQHMKGVAGHFDLHPPASLRTWAQFLAHDE